MKQLWKKYHRYKRITENAKWYLLNKDPWCINLMEAYAYYLCELEYLEPIFGKPEPIRVKMNDHD